MSFSVSSTSGPCPNSSNHHHQYINPQNSVQPNPMQPTKQTGSFGHLDHKQTGSWGYGQYINPQNSMPNPMQNNYNPTGFAAPRSATRMIEQVPLYHPNPNNQYMQHLNQGLGVQMIQQQQPQPQLPAAQRRLPAAQPQQIGGEGDVLAVELERSLFGGGKPRLRWTEELHERFLRAVSELGGLFGATPKGIFLKMNVRGLNVDHIKSHLQKMRIKYSADIYSEETAEREGYSIALPNDSLNLGTHSHVNRSGLKSFEVDINAYGRLLMGCSETLSFPQNTSSAPGQGSADIQNPGDDSGGDIG